MTEANRGAAANLWSHPGHLGYATDSGEFIIGIHADWPVYPCPPGHLHALFDLTQIPRGVEFFKVDDIDQCMLFEARGYGERNPSERDRYYLAAWHSDLIALADYGLVSGVVAVTEREREAEEREELRNEIIKAGWRGTGDPLDSLRATEDGQEVQVTFAPLDTYDGDDEDFGDVADRDWAVVQPDTPVTVTSAGWQQANDSLAGLEIDYPQELSHVPDLIRMGLYDTAVREVAVTLETRLRRAVGGGQYGQRLVEGFIEDLNNRNGHPTSHTKILRLRLRAFFKFIRNTYAHQRVELSRPQALALIVHGMLVIEDVEGAVPDA